jgi:DNA-binding beta-propeller fold protein YncE
VRGRRWRIEFQPQWHFYAYAELDCGDAGQSFHSESRYAAIHRHGTFSDGSTQNLTSSATWNSSEPSVATISATGLATGVAAGSTTIMASSGALSGPTTLTVTQPPPRFAYVANGGDNTVSAYSVSASTGQLRTSGYALAGTDPVSVTVDPSGKFIYVANNGSANVSAFAINPSTGALTTVSGSPFSAGTGPQSVTVESLRQVRLRRQ